MLQELNVSHNVLTTLPPEVGALRGLVDLYAARGGVFFGAP